MTRDVLGTVIPRDDMDSFNYQQYNEVLRTGMIHFDFGW